MEEVIFERKINYYETDKMGIVHHSNYIRFLEEARCFWLQEIGIPFSSLEPNGVTIPVTFEDIITIKPYVKEYSGVRMTVGYDVKDKKTGKTVIIAETKHCFTDISLKPINLKKYAPQFNKKFEELLQNNNKEY